VSPLRVGAVLSLTGRFARFGAQAAHALRAWAELTPDVEMVVEDDAGQPARLRRRLRELRCDLLLGPYSTSLMRAAAVVAEDAGRLLWNHGGTGDDVQALAPGHVVSVPTPTRRYAEPYLRRLAVLPERAPLHLACGPGSFGPQVLAGARVAAERLGIPVLTDDGERPPVWDAFVAGTFEDDVALVTTLLDAGARTIGSVAAGVREFADAAPRGADVLGVAQWVRSQAGRGVPTVGPSEEAFLAAYRGPVPDYPAVQAAAAAALAVHCAQLAGSTARGDLWAAATGLRTSTLFGPFAVDPVTGTQVAHGMALVTRGPAGIVGAGP
jgi:hypothetical protein